jgi:peptidyl-prolyl cis-trans isomerase C
MRSALSLAAVLLGILIVAVAGCSREDSATRAAVGEASGQRTALNLEEESMAVTVNGKVVTAQEVAEERDRIVQQLAGRVPAEQMETMQEAIQKQAQENLINRILLEEAVESEGVEASREEVDTRLSAIRDNFESSEAFTSRLSAMGITEDDLRDEVASGLRMERLIEMHSADVETPSDSELRSFYDENSEQFTQPERVRASHVLFMVEPTMSDADKAAKRLEAAKILGEIQNGADFGQMASQHSGCPSKANGGDLGFFGQGQMVKQFEDAAFALGVGEVSDIVETQYGYHIIKVTDRQESSIVDFDNAKADIASFLVGQKKQEAVSAYIEGLRASATIGYPGAASPED